MRRLIAAMVLASLAGCAASTINTNPAGGLVRIRGTLNGQRKAMAIADQQCAKYGKVARYVSTNDLRGTVSYECVHAD